MIFCLIVALWSWSNRKSLRLMSSLTCLTLSTLYDPLPKCTRASSSTVICTERHFPGWLWCLAVLLAILDFTFCIEDQKACSDQKKEGQQLPWRPNMEPKVIFQKPCWYAPQNSLFVLEHIVLIWILQKFERKNSSSDHKPLLPHYHMYSCGIGV